MNKNVSSVQKIVNQAGVTMLELLIVIVMVSILAAAAGPSFTGTIARAEVNSMRDKLASALQFARSEALKRRIPVSVCPTTNQTGCANNTNWQTGWIVFRDTNGDGSFTGGDELLQVEYDGAGLNSTVQAYATGGTAVTFNRIGRASNGSGDYGLCHPQQPTTGRVVRVSVTGSVERRQETIGGCP